MTARAKHLVLHTDQADATAADVERWAAARGAIVTNIRQIPLGHELDVAGKTLRPTEEWHIWTGDIVVSEGIE